MAEEALLQEEKSRLDTASAMISTAIEQGAMSLQNLSHQKQFLKVGEISSSRIDRM